MTFRSLRESGGDRIGIGLGLLLTYLLHTCSSVSFLMETARVPYIIHPGLIIGRFVAN